MGNHTAATEYERGNYPSSGRGAGRRRAAGGAGRRRHAPAAACTRRCTAGGAPCSARPPPAAAPAQSPPPATLRSRCRPCMVATALAHSRSASVSLLQLSTMSRQELLAGSSTRAKPTAGNAALSLSPLHGCQTAWCMRQFYEPLRLELPSRR